MWIYAMEMVNIMMMALCSKHCISETAALICMCDTPLESLLNGLILDKFNSRRGAISTRVSEAGTAE